MEEFAHIDPQYEKWKEEFASRDANRDNIQREIASRIMIVWVGYLLCLCILFIIAGFAASWNKEAWLYVASPLIVFLPAIMLLPSVVRLTYIFSKMPFCTWRHSLSFVFPLWGKDKECSCCKNDDIAELPMTLKVNASNDPTIYERPDAL